MALPKKINDLIKDTAAELTEILTPRHYGPGAHPGTGTEQEVHGDNGAGESESRFAVDYKAPLEGYDEQAELQRIWSEGFRPSDPPVTIGEWLEPYVERGGIERTPEGLYVFYHGTPKVGGATKATGLRARSLMAFEEEKARFYASRDRDLDPEQDIDVFRLALRPSQFDGGVFPKLTGPLFFEDDPTVERHYGPGTHPGTGTDQTVHAPDGAGGGVSPRDYDLPSGLDTTGIREQMKRAENNGFYFIVGADNIEDRYVEMWKRAEENRMDYPSDWTPEQIEMAESLRDTETEVRARWRKNMEEAGGEPSAEWVEAVMDQVNQAVEDLGIENPLDVLLRRNLPKLDDDADGFFRNDKHAPERSFIEFYADSDEAPSTTPYNQAVSNIVAMRIMLTSQFYPSSFYGAYIHEMGHYEQDYNPEFEGTLARGNEWIGDGFAGETQIQKKRRSDLRRFLSDYSAEKPNEMFAEAYTLYQHPDYSEAPNPTRAIVEYILGINDDNPIP